VVKNKNYVASKMNASTIKTSRKYLATNRMEPVLFTGPLPTPFHRDLKAVVVVNSNLNVFITCLRVDNFDELFPFPYTLVVFIIF